MAINKNVNNCLQRLLTRFPELESISENLILSYSILENSFFNQKKIFVCGNGGSAADAEHIVGELMKSFLIKRKVTPAVRQKFSEILGDDDISGSLEMGLPAISLNGHPALSSAYSNDVDASMVYAQQLFVMGCSGDALIGISTSGNSKSVCNAMKVARAKGIKTILLTGQNNGICEKFADCRVKAPSLETYRIQEYHLPIYHTLCMMLEERFYGNND